jgi:hypothetical protein
MLATQTTIISRILLAACAMAETCLTNDCARTLNSIKMKNCVIRAPSSKEFAASYYPNTIIFSTVLWLPLSSATHTLATSQGINYSRATTHPPKSKPQSPYIATILSGGI